MMKLKNNAENLGERNIIIFVMIDPKREMKEDTVSIKKTKTRILNVLRNQRLIKDDKKYIQA